MREGSRAGASKPRQRAAARVAPFRDTPGASARGLPEPEGQAIDGGRLPGAAPLGRRSAIAIARAPHDQADRGRPRAAQAPLDLAFEPVADHRRRHEGEQDHDGTTARRTAEARRAITRRCPIRSAAAAPAWSATSKLFLDSGSISSQGHPASQGSSERWAELETGSSSAGPGRRPGRPLGTASVRRRRDPRSGRRRSVPTWRSRGDAGSAGRRSRSRSRRGPRSRGSGGSPPLVPAIADLPSDDRQHQHPRDAARAVRP